DRVAPSSSSTCSHVSYQVYIDGPADPGKVQAVATAIGSRFGLPPATLMERLTQGRFRVKKDIDLATAQVFAAQLRELGALASVIGPDGQPVIEDGDDEPLLSLVPEAPAV